MRIPERRVGTAALLTLTLALLATWTALAGVGRAAGIPTATPTPTNTVQPWDDILVNQHGRDRGIGASNSFVQGDEIYGAYLSADDGQYYLAHSTDAGQSWLPERPIPLPGLAPHAVAYHADRDRQPPAIYVISNTGPALWLVASPDGGQSWNGPYLVYDGQPGDMGPPSLVIDDRHVLYAWWAGPQSNRFLTHSADGGQTWSNPVQVNQGYITQGGGRGRIVPFGDRLYVADSGYFPPGRTHVWFFHSDDRGQTWSTPVQVDTWWYHGGSPIAAVDRAGVLYVAWGAEMEPEPNQEEDRVLPYLARSTDEGQTWSLPVRLDDAYFCPMPLASGSVPTSLVVDETTAAIHVVLGDGRHSCFHEGSFQQDLFYTYSTDGGVTWSRNVQLNDPVVEGLCGDSSLTVQGDRLFTTFEGNAPGLPNLQYFLDIHQQPLPPRTITPTPVPTATPTPTGAPTGTPLPTATRTPTAAPTRTSTALPSATPTATGTVTPSPLPGMTPPVTPSPTPGEWRVCLPWVEKEGAAIPVLR